MSKCQFFLVLHENFQFGKFKRADFKYDDSFFKS